MQLRVARLCLDCEELYVGDSCPVCASEHSAFLAAWLGVEERRRWRRQPHKPASKTERRKTAFRQFLSDIFGDGSPVRMPGPPRTRAADHVPDFGGDRPSVTPKAARQTTDPQTVEKA
jgi:hypothetical protein